MTIERALGLKTEEGKKRTSMEKLLRALAFPSQIALMRQQMVVVIHMVLQLSGPYETAYTQEPFAPLK